MKKLEMKINGYNPTEVFIIDTHNRDCPRVWKIVTRNGVYMLDIDDTGYFAYIPNDYLIESFSLIYSNITSVTLAEFLDWFLEDHDFTDILDIEIF